MKTVGFGIFASFLAVFYWFFDNASYETNNSISETESEQTVEENKEDLNSNYDYKIETVVENLYVPWSIVFTDENRILVNERDGSIREVLNGTLNETPLYTVEDLYDPSEAGLMGMTKDPNYANNKYLYICYTYQSGGVKNKILRLVDNATSIDSDQVIFDFLPSASNHAGCELAFGPDGKLYVTLGDALNSSLAQDWTKYHGKILRLNPDGSVPSDNPVAESPIWAYGLRNSQDIVWNSAGDAFAVDHGPSGFDGPKGGDEVNYIIKGYNYGRPLVSHEETKEGIMTPIKVFTPAIAPGGLLSYEGDMFPAWKDDLFVGGLKGETIVHMVVKKSDYTYEVISFEKMEDVDFGRIRKVVQGPDGSIYFSTSNEDGRGTKRSGGDKIYRIFR